MNNKRCFFISELFSPQIGGSCSLFKGRFKKFNNDQLYVLTATHIDSEKFDLSVNYQIGRIKINRWKVLRGFEWVGVCYSLFVHAFRLLRKIKFRYIECSRPLPEGVVGLLLSVLFRKKLVVNVHGEEVAVLKNYKIERFLLSLVFKRATLIIANSFYTETLIGQLCNHKNKVIVIFPGFEPDNFNNDDDKIMQPLNILHSKRPILLTVGRLQSRKGQDMVIKSIPLLLNSYPDLLYIIAGSEMGGTEGYFDYLKHIAEKENVLEHVLFTGEISNKILTEFFKLCDVFILANRVESNGDVEGFGIVFLEAGFFRKPVIGGLAGGSRDAVIDEKTGLLVDTTSAASIAQAIRRILDNKAFALRCGEAGYERALLFTTNLMAEKYTFELERLKIIGNGQA